MHRVWTRRRFLGTLGLTGLGLLSPGILQAGKEDNKPPNILFITLDDLNDWTSVLDPKAPIKTPNIERLAKRGTLFTHAYCASAACNPSRTAILTGLRPTTSGVYGNKADWRKALPDAVTIPQHFMAHGYRTEGAGKIFHHHYGGAFHDKASFHDFLMMPDPPDAPMPKKKLNGLAKYGSPNTDWGPWPADEADAIDVRTADYVIRSLRKKHDKPFFLAAGIFRPHMPFFAPQRFFDLYPSDNVTMPEILEGDIDDLPSGASKLLKSKKWFFKELMEIEAESPGTWKEAVRGYQASATFADAQVGRILDALDKSNYADNTIIVLWSDHGYHLGEKEHWEKFALWEKTNHVPFIIAAPGITHPDTHCDKPVSLLDIYPTLIELCSLKAKPELDGISLMPLLRNPEAEWTRPALMTYMRGNHAVRDERWRYILYADGTEELYDHQNDPNEWTNVAGDPKNKQAINRLKRWLPTTEAPPAPDMKRPKT
ncbi:MAG: sulfatase [Sedimentisphaerales bacterium]|nr:sulfatase [Sedimentisphaerales bacterium]